MIFKGLKRSEYHEDTIARVVASVGSDNFFRDLINSVIFQNSFTSAGRMEFFVCLPPSVFMQLTCSSSAGYFLYRQSTVLFQILFEYQYIARINRKHFLPWQTKTFSTPRKEKHLKYDNDFMYLIRVEPRPNLLEYCTLGNLPALWYFIKQHLRSRSKAVIPIME
jgi:dimethyladenosine transferase 2